MHYHEKWLLGNSISSDTVALARSWHVESLLEDMLRSRVLLVPAHQSMTGISFICLPQSTAQARARRHATAAEHLRGKESRVALRNKHTSGQRQL